MRAVGMREGRYIDLPPGSHGALRAHGTRRPTRDGPNPGVQGGGASGRVAPSRASKESKEEVGPAVPVPGAAERVVPEKPRAAYAGRAGTFCRSSSMHFSFSIVQIPLTGSRREMRKTRQSLSLSFGKSER